MEEHVAGDFEGLVEGGGHVAERHLLGLGYFLA